MPGVKRRRTSSKARSAKSVSQATKAYVQRALSRVGEKKWIHFNDGRAYSNKTVTSFNIMYQAGVSEGTDWENRVVGTKIRIHEIIVRGQLSNNLASTKSSSVALHIAVVKAPEYRTATNYGYSELFLGTADEAPCNIFNPNQCTPLVEKVVKCQPSIAYNDTGAAVVTQDVSQGFEMRWRGKMVFDFRDLSNTYEGKKENLYVIVYMSNPASGGTAGGLGMRVAVKFTDM